MAMTIIIIIINYVSLTRGQLWPLCAWMGWSRGFLSNDHHQPPTHMSEEGREIRVGKPQLHHHEGLIHN